MALRNELPYPDQQAQLFSLVNVPCKDSMHVSISGISVLEEIMTSNELGKQTEVKSISNEMLFASYKGQQLHMLNELMTMVTRNVRAHFINVKEVYPGSNTQLSLRFSETTIASYFPSEDKHFHTHLANMFTRHLLSFPELHPKRVSRKTRIFDELYQSLAQLTFNIWTDWRQNQVFTLKKGVIPGGRRKNSDYYDREAYHLQRTEMIWHDTFLGHEAEITTAAVETLASWTMLLIHCGCFEQNQLNSDMLNILLNVEHVVEFERLSLIHVFLDESAANKVLPSYLLAQLSGKPDVLVRRNDKPNVIVDFKSTLKPAHILETLLTKMQGTDLSGYEIKASLLYSEYYTELMQSIGEIDVHHVDTSKIRINSDCRADFASQEQTIFNPWEEARYLLDVIAFAFLHHESITKPVQERRRKENQVPAKHEFREKYRVTKKISLPNFQTLADRGDFETDDNGMLISGVPRRVLSLQVRKKIQQVLRNHVAVPDRSDDE